MVFYMIVLLWLLGSISRPSQRKTVSKKTSLWYSVINYGCFAANFEIYCGKDEARKTPLGSHVVNTMLEPIEKANCHRVFFFTSHKLFTYRFSETNIRACGTVRDDCTVCFFLLTNTEIKKRTWSYDSVWRDCLLCKVEW